MHCQEIKQNVSDGRAEFSQTTQASGFLTMTNTASCGVKYLRRNGAAGHRIEEIHIIAEGESQLNLRTRPLSGASARVCTRLSSSPVGINNVIKKEKACEGKNFTAKIKLGTEIEKL